MSSQSSGRRRHQSSWEQKRAIIRETHDDLGRPPSQRECSDGTPFSRTCFECDPTWAKTLRRAGVPTPREVVIAALDERFADRYPWEETVRLKPYSVAEVAGLPSRWTARVLAGLDGAEVGEFRIERHETDSNAADWWEVKPRE